MPDKLQQLLALVKRAQTGYLGSMEGPSPYSYHSRTSLRDRPWVWFLIGLCLGALVAVTLYGCRD